jgi:hypothetical protein
MRKQRITTHVTAALMLGGLTILVAGCSSDHYDRVTHPTSGNEYDTRESARMIDTLGGKNVKGATPTEPIGRHLLWLTKAKNTTSVG